jgi:hypothetical protein
VRSAVVHGAGDSGMTLDKAKAAAGRRTGHMGAIQILDQMNRRLDGAESFEHAIRRILNDSMSLNGAEFGTLQLPWAFLQLSAWSHRALDRFAIDLDAVVVEGPGEAAPEVEPVGQGFADLAALGDTAKLCSNRGLSASTIGLERSWRPPGGSPRTSSSIA